MLDKIRKYKRACSTIANSSALEPDEEIISRLTGMDVQKLEEVKDAIKKEPVSLDALVTEDLTIQDYVEDTSYISPEISTQNHLQEKDVIRLLNRLDKREQEILRRRFGIENSEPKTLEQIGKSMGFSKERIRQIENLAIQKLRRIENVDNLKSYLDAV